LRILWHVEGDPLADGTSRSTVKWVMKGGVVVLGDKQKGKIKEYSRSSSKF